MQALQTGEIARVCIPIVSAKFQHDNRECADMANDVEVTEVALLGATGARRVQVPVVGALEADGKIVFYDSLPVDEVEFEAWLAAWHRDRNVDEFRFRLTGAGWELSSTGG